MWDAILTRYGISLTIGILVGMQRQIATDREGEELPAGVRTFALVGIWGCAAAQVSDLMHSAAALGASMAILGAFLTAMYFAEAKKGFPGLTTAVSSLVTFLAGALAYHNQISLAGALGVVATLILSLKLELHTLARNLTQTDVFSTLKFAVLGVVILPLLPNRTYGLRPFDMLNPFEIGLFVVLISGVGFLGYVLAKALGAKRGIGIMGLIGGLVSSTAVTMGFTQRSRSEPALSGDLALAILASWVVMFTRTSVLVTALEPAVGRRLWVPLGAAMSMGALWCLYLYRRGNPTADVEKTPYSNPFELGPAIRFGLLFVVILIVARGAQILFGDIGMYLSSFLGGMVDVDAISFSMTRLAGGGGSGGGIDPRTAGNGILLAALANTLLKGAVAVSTGSPGLRKAIFPGLALMIAGGVAATWIS